MVCRCILFTEKLLCHSVRKCGGVGQKWAFEMNGNVAAVDVKVSEGLIGSIEMNGMERHGT